MAENPHVKQVRFVTSAVDPEGYPPLEGMAEVAVAGRSNVGKSSLINGLVNRRRLARVSNTPGRTQLLNFFVVNEAFVLCDLPGYGFARVPDAVRRRWAPMIETYLTSRESLRALLLLIDVRREPGEREVQLIRWASAGGLAVVPVVTKVDKLGRSKRGLAIQRAAETLGFSPRRVIGWSATTGEGLEPLWRTLVRVTGTHPAG